jgi:ABC-type sugar transport system substrate-binding protein
VKLRMLGLATLGTAIALLAACSSPGTTASHPGNQNSDSAGAAASASGSSGSTGAAGLASAKQLVAEAANEPTQIPTTTALPKAPQRGLKVALLTCSDGCSQQVPGFIAAAEALGWKPTVITYNSATPGQALQEAIDVGYKYIATQSITLNTITPQMQEAKARDIPIFGSYTEDIPGGASNGLYAVAQGKEAEVELGKQLAAWTIVDSNQAAKAVYVSLPIYPSLVDEGEGAQSEYAADCPNCTFDTLNVTDTQVGAGQVPAAVVSYLESHPSVNYVYLAYAILDAGVSAAIKHAGLANRVKIIGAAGGPAQLREIVAGQESAWMMLPEVYVSWTLVDWMARESERVLTAQSLEDTASGPRFIVDTSAAARSQLTENGGNWPGPQGYEDQFKALWHVSS